MHPLAQKLETLDGKGYGAYKSLKGEWRFPDFTLFVDHVQGDPFAAPSRLRAILPPASANLPADAFSTPARRWGAAACLARAFANEAEAHSTRSGSGHSGKIEIAAPGQKVLPQTALQIADDGAIDLRFRAGLPAQGRRIKGAAAHELLLERIPELVCALGRVDPLHHAEVNEDAEALRTLVHTHGWVAFVADGARLPRRTGVDDRPLEEDVVPFVSPDSLRVEVDLPNAGKVTGMAIPEGVTLITGGGYHGKSTLLRALEQGVYNHRPGDGRERVVTEPDAVKIRAEDGRSVAGVDISGFIGPLPGGSDTRAFSTPNASGSTSQAAALAEALEAGARTILVDEDTAATNFMIRDRRIQALVTREPITPFIDRIREIGASSVLVLGGSGDYLDVADLVVMMDHFRPHDVTARARKIVEDHPTGRQSEGTHPLSPPTPRIPLPIDPTRGRRREHIKVRETLHFGTEEIDLRGVDQIISREQIRAIARGLLLVSETPIPDLLDRITALELDELSDHHPGDLAAFRRHELAAALNRLRTLRVAPRPAACDREPDLQTRESP